jgi:glyoxylase-like metal-dependent hydrolase (beta-lactamase superfamily II)
LISEYKKDRQMLKWKIGNVSITRVVELEAPTSVRFMFAGVSKEELLSIEWLKPHFVTDSGHMLFSIHALLVESQGRKIIVDTCLGNDKERKVAGWGMRNGPFLEDIASAGFARESIDAVMCTHLHVDHVGWNTMREGDRWVPTFPNAEYLFAKDEWAYWSEHEQDEFGPVVEDSVRPIVDAGLARLVDSDHQLTSEVWLEPTPGHTPGHVSVRISSEGEDAVITGDMTHHPCQMAHPDWAASVDVDSVQSTQTRHEFYARYADQPVLLIGTHFATPTAGRLITDGDAYRFAVD